MDYQKLLARVCLFSNDTRLWIEFPTKGGSAHLDGSGFV